MNKGFICPICAKELVRKEKSFLCENSHCFDISKYGYVNLLTTGGKKGHGDDKLMVNARHDFLNKGYYEHLREAVCHEAEKYMQGARPGKRTTVFASSVSELAEKIAQVDWDKVKEERYEASGQRFNFMV